jgi:hypothetical protein
VAKRVPEWSAGARAVSRTFSSSYKMASGIPSEKVCLSAALSLLFRGSGYTVFITGGHQISRM